MGGGSSRQPIAPNIGSSPNLGNLGPTTSGLPTAPGATPQNMIPMQPSAFVGPTPSSRGVPSYSPGSSGAIAGPLPSSGGYNPQQQHPLQQSIPGLGGPNSMGFGYQPSLPQTFFNNQGPAYSPGGKYGAGSVFQRR